ncbi:N-alpha-acetyltransferase 40-like isoform X2 [Ostrea edulis]|uniref:N-alpha-acetyltransferase 40-like isoform X2 n=1 Tax=Ostrea edulis TaxID=37623 RepID=UPI0024AF3273|nr:N-alpha-acetyltransferase 40-like isoform X2 [Ostrea edulis]
MSNYFPMSHENAKYEASLAKVEAANKIPDPLDLVPPFKKFERNGLNVRLECKKVTNMEKELVDWAFQLTKANMQTLYEESDWGWKDKDKYSEMTEEKAQYLVAVDVVTSKPVAFTHFRFDMELDEEVVYCYEIQLEEDCRRKGLGKFLMQILELLAYKTEMTKVMLTTFKNNKVSQDFFKKTMKYEVDEISPEDPLFDDAYHYEILSKAIKPKPKPSAAESVTAANHQLVTAS